MTPTQFPNDSKKVVMLIHNQPCFFDHVLSILKSNSHHILIIFSEQNQANNNAFIHHCWDTFFNDLSISFPIIFFTFLPEIIETFFGLESDRKNSPTCPMFFSPTTICLGSSIVCDFPLFLLNTSFL